MENAKKSKHPQKLLKLVLIGLVALQVVILIFFMLVVKNNSTRSSDSANDNSFFPYWLIVFIPIIATRKKSKTENQKKNWLIFMVGLSLAVLIAMLVFFLQNIR